ncbi:MAG: apolipoprotein N-acyltransferase [Bacteroidales bacterium]|jgi:apolipoprotein N-acyltransferase|nr:apolipoprotein N-acyltransferase [Bacteroidales bacterium]
MLQQKNKIFFSLISGVLLWLSWYPYGFTYLIFFAFVPLFVLSDRLIEKNKGFSFWQGIWFSFPAFLIWNIGVTWWIWNCTIAGAIAAIGLNSFFMSCVFGVWHWVKNSRLPKFSTVLAFIAFWCSWEFLHLNWQINWPWLNIGNVFATHPKIVQWYEYTGAFGGTIWVLVVNFLCYDILQKFKQIFFTKKSVPILSFLRHLGANKIFITLIITITAPIIISFIIYKTYTIKQQIAIEAVVVQQNIDPWNEQYVKTNLELAELILEVALSKLSSNTELLVCSESALSQTINEEHLYNMDIYPHPEFMLFDSLLHYYPNLNIVLGLSTVNFDNKILSASNKTSKSDRAEYYNTSGLYRTDTLQMYRKSRLVPGVEKMPYPKIFGFLENIAIDLGGISGSLGTDSIQRVFNSITKQGTVKIGVPICYESIFGELFSKFVKNGAQLMCVITNDSWWGDSPGYKQHFEMSALRAIETRRYIIRAANSGISGFFDPLGNASQRTKYETRKAISQIVYPNNEITFYVKYGDFLARIMIGIAVLFLFKKLKDICASKKQKYAA